LTALGIGAGLRTLDALRHDGVALAQARGSQPALSPLPRNAVIRTVLADLDPASLADGATLMHEHLGGNFTSPPPQPVTPGSRPPAPVPRDDVKYVALMVDELKQTQKDGVRCIVDAVTGQRSDQQFENLKTIASRSGMHIVAAGGYYRAPYPAAVVQMTEEQLVEHLSQGARAQRWGAFGEIGTSMEMHLDERRMLRAISQTHLRTGVPIFTHIPHESCPKCAIEQLDLFESQGVDPRTVCIGHITSIRPDDDPGMDTAKAIAKRGAFLGFDTVGHQGLTSLVTDGQKVKMLLAVLDAGYEDRVLISADFTQVQLLKSNWGDGFSTALNVFLPKLRYAGVSEAAIRRMTVDNPRRFLAFVPKSGRG
jgi:phosphotriesterase-related protein